MHLRMWVYTRLTRAYWRTSSIYSGLLDGNFIFFVVIIETWDVGLSYELVRRGSMRELQAEQQQIHRRHTTFVTPI